MSVYLFLGVAILGTIVIAITNRVPLSWWGRAGIAIVATGAIVAIVYEIAKPATLGGDGSIASFLRSSPVREFLLFGCLLVGMAASVLSVAIERREAAKREPAAPDVGLQIDKWQFVYPMLFAIPTFGALLTQVSGPLLSVTDSILAFQTGFFWQTILKAK
jgi:hypothetical protein